MIYFQTEPFQTLKPELGSLIKAHWLEVSPDPEFFQLDPAWEIFDRMDELGLVVAVTARRVDNDELVGYIIYLIQPMMHYKNLRLGQEDAHYLKPEYRKGWTAVRMFRIAEGILRSLGVHLTVVHTKMREGLDRGPVFKRLGYQPHETLYLKRL